MRRKPLVAVSIATLLAAAPLYFLVTSLASGSSSPSQPLAGGTLAAAPDPDVVARFEYLSGNGNSSCSRAFMDSISSMPNDMRLRGSCCGPMSLHRYSEQVAALKKYGDIPDIPPDPYDIQAELAKKLKSQYTVQLASDEQEAYDFAMAHSSEQGPCCCQCWRWEVYGGLGKYLIRNYGFTGEQVTDVWDMSNGCGGDGEHFHETATRERSPPDGGFAFSQEVLA